MYFQSNFYNQRPQLESNVSITHPMNVTEKNNFENLYSPLRPPPLPPFFVESSRPPPFINKYQQPGILLKGTPYLQSCSALHNTREKLSEKTRINLPFSDINVTSIRRDFIKCSALLKELERLINFLQIFKKTSSEGDWTDKCNEIKTKEEEIAKLLSKYDNEDYFFAVQRIVKKCFKKRMYRKKKKKEWQEMKKVRKAFKEREHRRIDLWLEKMKDQVEKSQRQEQVKRDADIVLSEVTTKKAEAKRFINLLNTLTKLRNARVQQLNSVGSFVSENETNSFTQVVDKLKKLWLDQLKDYNLEEQGLRVMLNDAEIERVNVEEKVTIQIKKKWLEILFGGKKSLKQPTVPNNLEEFIAIRYEWDRFITNDNTCLSSKIPVGWIVPSSEPSNSEWSKFLQT